MQKALPSNNIIQKKKIHSKWEKYLTLENKGEGGG